MKSTAKDSKKVTRSIYTASDRAQLVAQAKTMTVFEAAQKLGIPRATAARWVRDARERKNENQRAYRARKASADAPALQAVPSAVPVLAAVVPPQLTTPSSQGSDALRLEELTWLLNLAKDNRDRPDFVQHVLKLVHIKTAN